MDMNCEGILLFRNLRQDGQYEDFTFDVRDEDGFRLKDYGFAWLAVEQHDHVGRNHCGIRE